MKLTHPCALLNFAHNDEELVSGGHLLSQFASIK